MEQSWTTPLASRRETLKAGGALLALASLAPGMAQAQAAAKHRRPNVNSPAGAAALASYKKAIRAMLALPPTDPRNWYRNALVHTVDCPHGNWWFLVWHRGYIGWFEQICRDLSGDPAFVLPYWDWSENTDPSKPFAPALPAAMYDDVLTPTHPAFLPTYPDFFGKFKDVVRKLDWWDTSQLNGRYGQLLARGMRFPDDLWFDIADDPRGLFFFNLATARGLPKDHPELDANTTKTVTLAMLLDALSPRDFITFASPKTYSHGGLTGFGVLEGQPHNNVHNCVGGAYNNTGGFMQANLSPVDPLFFLHHANIDRIWDVWTRKQLARKYPVLPEGGDLGKWSAEPFLFFVDAKGAPVSKVTAGDYATIGDFDYDYAPGSGEEVVLAPATFAAVAAVKAASAQRFTARIQNATVAPATPARATVAVPAALLRAAATGQGALFAQVTVSFPPLGHGPVALFLNAPGDAKSLTSASPQHVATLAMFGHHTMHGPVTFTVPLGTAVATLRGRSLIDVNAPLSFTLAQSPAEGGMAAMAHGPAGAGPELLSVSIETH